MIHRSPTLRQTWRPKSSAGILGICPITELELLVSARSSSDREGLLRYLEETYTWVLMPDRVYQRARQVQDMLTKLGQHRSAGAVDLLVAATAELSGRTLLHHDRDFETVAAATGQPAQWLATPGSID